MKHHEKCIHYGSILLADGTECPCDCHKEKWNENVETCSDCNIQWKKIGKPCPVCFAPAEKHNCEKCESEAKNDITL